MYTRDRSGDPNDFRMSSGWGPNGKPTEPMESQMGCKKEEPGPTWGDRLAKVKRGVREDGARGGQSRTKSQQIPHAKIDLDETALNKKALTFCVRCFRDDKIYISV